MFYKRLLPALVLAASYLLCVVSFTTTRPIMASPNSSLSSKLVVTTPSYTLSLSLNASQLTVETAASHEIKTEAEIQHLLTYIASTPCQYERNGKRYSGNKALTHIKKKHDYFKDDIQSAEDFIELAASKSSLSGKPYTIHCNNKPAISSYHWLMAELKRIRLE